MKSVERRHVDFEYPKRVRFECNRCAICCGDTEKRARAILMLNTEAERIARETVLNVGEFAEKNEGSDPYVFRMKKTKDGRCMFLKRDSCSAYPLRPLVCRFYPFELKKPENDRYVFTCTDECPGIGKGRVLKRHHFAELLGILRESLEESHDTV